MPAKGKRLLPRMAKWLGRERSLTVLSLIVATFSQVDVVARAPLLDSIEPSELRAEIERQTHLWQETVQVVFQQVVNQASLRIITSLFAMMMHRNNIVAVAGTEVSMFSQLVATAC
jgi:DNA topoisomerase 2-associated protein PAT1